MEKTKGVNWSAIATEAFEKKMRQIAEEQRMLMGQGQIAVFAGWEKT